MTDIVSPEKRSQMMSNIGSLHTKPEIIVRRVLHRAGFRFRLHRKDLPGRPDIILPKYRLAIFVNGCFWHGHDACQLFRLPKSRTYFWAAKIAANRTRDERVTRELAEAGWRVGTVWECAIKGRTSRPVGELAMHLETCVRSNKLKFDLRGS